MTIDYRLYAVYCWKSTVECKYFKNDLKWIACGYELASDELKVTRQNDV